MRYTFFLLISLIFSLFLSSAVYSSNRQEIEDFYLSNLREDGTSDWEIKGNTAVLDGDCIDIQTMDANYYLEEDIISIKSNQARLNKKSQDMHLKGNVEIKNSQGWTLWADYLNWQQEQNHIKTSSPVKTTKSSLVVLAKGLHADSQLEKADFQKDVQVAYSDEDNHNALTINCDGPLEIEYGAGRATFKNNVVVKHQQGTLFSDTATLFFDTEEERIVKIISEGNVKIIRDNNVTFAEKATYLADEEKLTLEGNPRLIYFPHGDESGPSGF